MTTITQTTVFHVSHIEQLPLHFCFESSRMSSVFDNDTQSHANKGAHQIKVHSLA